MTYVAAEQEPVWTRRAVLIGLVLLGAALSLARQRGVGALDTLWAEDGAVFLQTALADASPRAWLDSYAGYMHIISRPIASLAAVLPLVWASVIFAAGPALVASALAVVVFYAAQRHIPSPVDRAFLAISVLAAPSAGIEVANAVANIHWYVPIAAVWVTLWRTNSRLEVAIGSLVLFAAGASDPFVIFVGPVLAWRVLTERRPVDFAFATAWAAGIGLQGLVILTSAGSRPLDPTSASVGALAKWYGFHVLESAVFGITLRDILVEKLGVAASALLAVLILAFLSLPALRASLRRPFVPAVLITLHAALFFVPVALSGIATPRYAVNSILLLYAFIAWGFASEHGSHTARRGLGGALLVLITVIDFAPWNPRAEGPRWSEELSKARAACMTQPQAAERIRIPPRNLPPSDDRGLDGYWTVVVPCGRITAE